MNAKRIMCAAAVPVALILGGCESAPMKDMQRMFGSMLPSDQSKAADQSAAQPIPPQVIVAAGEAPEQEQTRPAPVPVSRGANDLKLGVSKYEDGAYSEASARLQSALSAGLASGEAVRAHKYLAFIHCASKRERQCRTEFRKALAIDPEFQLNAAESGHPMWGRVFRDVKQRG